MEEKVMRDRSHSGKYLKFSPRRLKFFSKLVKWSGIKKGDMVLDIGTEQMVLSQVSSLVDRMEILFPFFRPPKQCFFNSLLISFSLHLGLSANSDLGVLFLVFGFEVGWVLAGPITPHN
jgi:hypothetical protein